MSGNTLLKQATEAVERAFSGVPFCTVKLSKVQVKTEPAYVDLQGKVLTRNKEFRLFVEIKNSGQPRYTREAVNVLARQISRFKNAYGIFVAPFISAEASKILAAENIGYVDLSGNCRICIDGVYICKEGNQNRFAKKRDLQSLYSPKGERVLRALMLEPKRVWKVEPLAEQAQVSLGQVSNIKKLLEAREWLRREHNGFILVEPEKLLSEWSSTYRFRRHRITECYSLDSLAQIEKQLAGLRQNKRFGALTGFSAAARFAPATRYQRVSAFVHTPAEVIASKLGWKTVTSGANVGLIEPYDAGVFLGAQQVEGLAIVSPVQTYIDLCAITGRGEEAAQALLQEVLQPLW